MARTHDEHAPQPKAKRTPAAKASAEQDGAKIWGGRLTAANKDYSAWSMRFHTDQLADYYAGRQWRGASDVEAAKKYVINLIFATMETQLPSLMFTRPQVSVEPRPGRSEQAGGGAARRATAIESMLQTQIDDPTIHFLTHTRLALRDAYFRFGLVEVGYSADYIDNPNAGKPVLKDDDKTPMVGSDGEAVTQPKRTLQKESAYVKRLPPHAFRVSPGRPILQENDWVAYYEWHFLGDVKGNKEYQNTDTLGASSITSTEPDGGDDGEREQKGDRDKRIGMVKVWKIYDFRRKVRHVLADGHAKMLQENKPFSVFPIAALKFYELENEWYPLPPVFNWMSPQDEINESREQMRVHRRRFNRRFMREPSVSQVEFDKLEVGGDGVCIEVPKVSPPPIVPIEDAPLDGANWTQLAATKEDFTLISGSTGESRGVPEAPTATQANIENIRQQLRESSAREMVGAWLGEIARLLLLTMRERMQLAMMVKRSVDPFNPAAAAVKQSAQSWMEIKREDITDLDVDIEIDISSLSPVAKEAERTGINIVLAMLKDQALLMVLMPPNPEAPEDPPPLLVWWLNANGIKSDRKIREIWRCGQATLLQMQLMAAAAAVAGSGGGAPGMFAPAGGGDTTVPSPDTTNTGEPTPAPA